MNGRREALVNHSASRQGLGRCFPQEGSSHEDIARRRFVCGVLIVVLVLAAVPLSAWAESRVQGLPQGSGAGTRTGAETESLLNEAQRMSEACVPEGFEQEVLSLQGRYEVRCDAESGTVGFSVYGEASDVFERVSSDLATRGWQCHDGGAGVCASFTKDAGSYRWAFVQCVPVGEWTCVVVSCQFADGAANGVEQGE